MKKTLKNIMLALGLAVLTSACGSNGSKYHEPADSVEGFGVTLRDMKHLAVDETGKNIFAGKVVVNEYGEEINGDNVVFDEVVSCCVNGFYRLKADFEYYLLSKELDKENKLKKCGPYRTVGMFYEDVTPACVKGEGIGYINRDGEVVFWLDQVLGAKGQEAYNFMGGLSVVGVKVPDSPILVYGAIDTKGNIVLPFEYQKLEYAGSHLWYAERLDKNADKAYADRIADIIDREGKSIYSFTAEDYEDGTFAYDNGNNGPHRFAFDGEYAILHGQWGDDFKIINRSGEILAENIPGIKISSHCGEYFAFYDKAKDLCGIMNAKGEVKIEPQYKSISLLGNKLFRGYNGEEYVIYDYSGDQKYRWGKSLPYFVRNKCFYEKDKNGLFITPLEEPGATTVVSAGFTLSHYDDLLLKPILSDNREMWMPEQTAKQEGSKPQTNQVNDKQIANVAGPVKKVQVFENGYECNSYEFDEQGFLTHLDDTKLTTANSTRDESGRLTRVTFELQNDFGDSMEHVVVFAYSEDGLLQSRSASDDFGDVFLKYMRNGAGEITGYTAEGEGGSNKITYKYENFDENHNWTKAGTKDSYGNNCSLTRKITYY